ncbi:MAG: hypothetical protein ABF306_03405 [Nocardioides marinisabuli]|uniref:hypothetical protein n=1 Tax=Nocardioides marinisabuli TaxID=419476 RepID=UPI003219D03F
MTTQIHLVALHLGALHPVERALTLALAFGPFVVLGVVVWWRSRHEQDEHDGHGPVERPEDPAQRDR